MILSGHLLMKSKKLNSVSDTATDSSSSSSSNSTPSSSSRAESKGTDPTQHKHRVHLSLWCGSSIGNNSRVLLVMESGWKTIFRSQYQNQ